MVLSLCFSLQALNIGAAKYECACEMVAQKAKGGREGGEGGLASFRPLQ